MVEGRRKSRTFRRIHVTTPGGKRKILYKRRKPKIAHCAKCRGELHGVPRELPYKMKRLQKTRKRPERTFGGVLCHNCLKEKVLKEVIGEA